MKYKVRIKQTPIQKARTGMQVDYGLYNDISAMGGASSRGTQSEFATTKSITGVPRDEANLEAEAGETVYGDLNGDGMPEQNIIKGKRHSEGGVPLNLPEGTFIFSDTKSMRIKDCEILQMFNKPCGKKSYTPADLAKVFDLNAYREILQDPNSDKLDVRTAERMLKNYTIKLGALALAQESLKGFPQGIPAVAEPYMMAAGISAEEVLPPPEMTKLKDSIKKDIESQQEMPQEGMAPDPGGIQQAVDMNQGNPIAVPTDAQQQMMPPQMQQPQEMLGQPEPGMMPPQEQMMARGGYIELGGFDMPFVMAQGGYAPTQRVRIKELPKADNGRIVIDRSKYGSDSEYEQAIWQAKKDGKTVYNEKGQKLGTNTSPRKVSWDDSWDPNHDYAKAYGSEDPSNPGSYIMSDDQKMIAANMYLTEKYLNEPKTKALVTRQIRAAAVDPNSPNYTDKHGNPTGKGVGDIMNEINSLDLKDKDGNPVTYSSLDNVPDQVLIDALMSQNKQAARIKARGINPKAFKDNARGYASDSAIMAANITDPVTGELVDTPAKLAALKNHYSDLGVSGGDLRGAFGSNTPTLEQLAYLGFMKTASESGSYTGDDAFAARYIQPEELGLGDEPSLYNSTTTTPIDGWEGNTDLGQTALAQLTDFEWLDEEEKKQEEPCECPEGIEPEIDPDTGECLCPEERVIPKEMPKADWWLQDTINTFGAVGDASMIQKQQPWDTQVDLRAPLARYDDPTKELDSNLGLYRQTADTMAQFAGPQGLTSRMSQARGQLAKEAANITKRYNTRNLALANSQEVRAADAANKEALMNRQVNKGLYDATMLADDRFNREKMAARVNRRKLYTQAITNRAQTQALNQLYPDYAVDPATGGFMMHTPNTRRANPNTSGTDYWKEREKCVRAGAPDPDKCADNAMKRVQSSSGTANSNQGANVLQMHTGYRSPTSYSVPGQKTGGPVYILGGNVYPF